jgi:hypothetical protein
LRALLDSEDNISLKSAKKVEIPPEKPWSSEKQLSSVFSY